MGHIGLQPGRVRLQPRLHRVAGAWRAAGAWITSGVPVCRWKTACLHGHRRWDPRLGRRLARAPKAVLGAQWRQPLPLRELTTQSRQSHPKEDTRRRRRRRARALPRAASGHAGERGGREIELEIDQAVERQAHFVALQTAGWQPGRGGRHRGVRGGGRFDLPCSALLRGGATRAATSDKLPIPSPASQSPLVKVGSYCRYLSRRLLLRNQGPDTNA